MLRRYICAAIILCFFQPCLSWCQDVSPAISDKTHARRIEQLKDYVVKINSRNIDKTKYKRDLDKLKEKIGDARIVLLGEGDHGQGTTYEMKGRLIRFLHEEMGFNVLAWESGFFDCMRMDEAFQAKNVSLQTAVDLGVFSVFGWPQENRPLFEYLWNIRNSDNPMIQVGVDCQFSVFESASTAFPDWLEEFFDAGGVELDPIITDSFRDKMESPHWDTEVFAQSVISNADYFLNALESNQTDLEQHYSDLKIQYARRLILNLRRLAEAWLQDVLYPDNPAAYSNGRDKAMGETLIAIADEMYPDEKIVVWAHNVHIARKLSTVESGWPSGSWESYKPYKMMGDWAYEHFGSEMYAVGVLTFEGSVKAPSWTYEYLYPPAEKGLVEWYLHELGKKYYWLDLKSLPARHWLNKTSTARIYFYPEAKGKWPQVYDAFLYIANMSPSTAVEEHK